jgi:hypothetical protein
MWRTSFQAAQVAGTRSNGPVWCSIRYATELLDPLINNRMLGGHQAGSKDKTLHVCIVVFQFAEDVSDSLAVKFVEINEGCAGHFVGQRCDSLRPIYEVFRRHHLADLLLLPRTGTILFIKQPSAATHCPTEMWDDLIHEYPHM